MAKGHSIGKNRNAIFWLAAYEKKNNHDKLTTTNIEKEKKKNENAERIVPDSLGLKKGLTM